MVTTRLISGPLPPFDRRPPREVTGAEVIFHGRVRGEEEGRKIVALDYEAYTEMAEKELRAIGEEVAEKYSIQDLFCDHRVGEVPVGEVSLRLVIWSRHRGEALEAVAWFVKELKERVPIWKWGITADGERFPSRGASHAHP